MHRAMSRHSDRVNCMRPIGHVDIRPPAAAQPERDPDPMIRFDCAQSTSSTGKYRSLDRYDPNVRRLCDDQAIREQSCNDDDHEYQYIVDDHRDWERFRESTSSVSPRSLTPSCTTDRIYENLDRVLDDRRRKNNLTTCTSSRYGKIKHPIHKSTSTASFNETRASQSKHILHRSLTDNWDRIQFPPHSISNNKTLSCTGLLQSTENIYENICEKCCQFYAGPECTKCVSAANPKKLTSSAKVGGFFTGVLSTFRSSGKPSIKSSSKRARPTIVHNVDSVFRTNQSFDLDEISRLKASARRFSPPSNNKTSSATYSPIYAELRHSPVALNQNHIDEHELLCCSLTNTKTHKRYPNKRCGLLLAECKHHCNDVSINTKQSSLIKNTTISVNQTTKPTATDPWVKHHTQSSESPSPPSPHIVDRDVTNRTSTTFSPCGRSTTHSSALAAWMTSLRWSPDEYAESVAYNVKCIPSSSFASCCTTLGRQHRLRDRDHRVERNQGVRYQRRSEHTHNDDAGGYCANNSSFGSAVTVRMKDPLDSNKNTETGPDDQRRRWAVTEFRENCLSARRQAIYVRSQRACDAAEAVESPAIWFVVRETPFGGADDSRLQQVKSRRECSSVVSIEQKSDVLLSSATTLTNGVEVVTVGESKVRAIDTKDIGDLITFPESDNTKESTVIVPLKRCISSYRKSSRRDRITRFYLSVGLNRSIVLSVDHIQLQWFLSQCSFDHTVSGLCNSIYNSFMDFLIAQSKEQSPPAILETTQSPVVPLRRPRQSPLPPPVIHRRSKMTDFERTPPPIPAPRRMPVLKDFERPQQRQPPLVRRRFEDFVRTDKETTIPRRNAEPNEAPPAVEEDIYQPIWKFQTVGQAVDVTNDEDHETYDDRDHDDDDNNDDDHHALDHDFTDDSADEWEVADEEFQYSITQTTDDQHPHIIATPFADPYRRVCVLICAASSKRNQLVYDLSQPLFEVSADLTVTLGLATLHELEAEYETVASESGASTRKKRDREVADRDANNNQPPADSVLEWKRMMRRSDYADDEEDVNLPASFQPHHIILSTDDNDEPFELVPETKPIEAPATAAPTNAFQKISTASTPIPIKGARSLPTSSPSETPPKKRTGIGSWMNKLQSSDRLDLASVSVSYDKREDVVMGLKFKPSITNPDIIAISNQPVFEVTLLELDRNERMIPLFLVECVRVIEKTENLETSGIYRASGKKESIDKLKKRMNEKCSKKSAFKYSLIESEDVHTVTGGLKQFFRELQTMLIPMQIVHDLPANLDDPDSIPAIRSKMQQLEIHAKETLKFLLRHLIKVHENSATNLMNATNLSIVWGACLFTSSVTSYDASDIVRKNTLIKVLILRYDDIFGPDSSDC